MAERHTPPPLLSAPLSIWLRPYHQAPSSDGAFFLLPGRNLSPSCRVACLMDRMSLCPMHGSYDAKCIADQKVKTYIGPVAGEAAPYPPPSDPLLATPDRNRFLLPRRRSTGLVQILLPCTGPSLAIWLRPYHQAPTSVGASFFCGCPIWPSSQFHTNLHGSTSDCAFVPQAPISDIAFNGGVRGDPASSKVSGSGQRPNGPAHPLGRGLFVFQGPAGLLDYLIPAQNC